MNKKLTVIVRTPRDRFADADGERYIVDVFEGENPTQAIRECWREYPSRQGFAIADFVEGDVGAIVLGENFESTSAALAAMNVPERDAR